MSGIYNETYFKNHPDQANEVGILYCVVLVNQKTFERECIKIGITKGSNYRNVVKRSQGFKGYDIRILKTYKDTLYNVWKLEQQLHHKFEKYQKTPENYFGGYTETFEFNPEIVKSIPSKK